MQTYTISKDLMSILISEQKEYRKEWLSKNPFWYSWIKNHETSEKWPSFTNRTSVYLLAGIGNEITSVIPMVKSSPLNAGCRIMSQINYLDFAIAMSKMAVGSEFMGIARIGAFHTHSSEYAGYTKDELSRINPRLVLLSLGRNGVLLEKAHKREEIHRLKLKVV